MFRLFGGNKQSSIFDADMWMGERTKKILENSWAPIFYENIYKKIDERPFSVLYNGTTGAPNFPVRIILSLELIKYTQDISDDTLLERYNFDYLVNYALGFRALGEMPLGERTIYNFRERLYLHTVTHPEAEDLIFGQFKTLTQSMSEAAGLSMEEQRIDTTQFMSNIKKSGRIALAYDVLVKGAKRIPECLHTETITTILTPEFKTKIIYKAKSSETDSKLTILLRYCQEILGVLEKLEDSASIDEIRILKRLLSEQSTTDENGEIEAKPGKSISPKSLQSAHDEEATYRKKNNHGHTGYVASVTETCSEDNPFQLITDYSVESNTVSDVEILDKRMEGISGTGCKTLYADGGFYSGSIIEEASEEGIEMQYTNMTGQGPSDEELTVDNFEFNESLDAVTTCPAGHTPESMKVSESYINAHFDKSICEQCQLREKCPVNLQKKTAAVRFRKEQVIASQQRKAMFSNFYNNISKRAAIEGTNSALKRKGMGKLRVRGKIKCRIVCGLMSLANNFNRFVKFSQGFYDKPEKNSDQGVFALI